MCKRSQETRVYTEVKLLSISNHAVSISENVIFGREKFPSTLYWNTKYTNKCIIYKNKTNIHKNSIFTLYTKRTVDHEW